MRRIYLDPVDCERDHSTIYIKGSSLHYISNVLRMKEGDIFTGFDGSGYEYEIEITSRDKRFLKGEILKAEKMMDVEPLFNIVLFQSIPKGSKMDKIIGEVAQLGVKKVYPVISNRVVPHIDKESIQHKKGRWKRLAAEASKIAGMETVMDIVEPIGFEEAVKLSADVKIIFWEKATTSLRDVIKHFPELKKGANIHIFIGPEGGYGDEEIALAQRYDVLSASIGKRILKVETASVIAVALTLYELENPTVIRENIKYSQAQKEDL